MADNLPTTNLSSSEPSRPTHAERLQDALRNGVGFALDSHGVLFRIQPMADWDPMGAAWWDAQRWATLGEGSDIAFIRYVEERLRAEPVVPLLMGLPAISDIYPNPLSVDEIKRAWIQFEHG